MFENYKTYSFTPFSIILVSLNTAAKWLRMLTATWANWRSIQSFHYYFSGNKTDVCCFSLRQQTFFSRGFAHWVGKDKKCLNDNRCHDQHCHDTDALPLNAFFFFFVEWDMWHYSLVYFNPLHPNISWNILHTVLSGFLRVLTRRICLTINSFFIW